jgi:hypothetical protein
MPVATTWYYRPTNSSRHPDFTPRREKTTTSLINQPRKRENSLVEISTKKSPAAMKELLDKLSRPTFSSRLRFECPGLGFSYRNRYQTWDGHFVWSKMDYLQDCYNCMWTRHGSVKTSTKI